MWYCASRSDATFTSLRGGRRWVSPSTHRWHFVLARLRPSDDQRWSPPPRRIAGVFFQRSHPCEGKSAAVPADVDLKLISACRRKTTNAVPCHCVSGELADDCFKSNHCAGRLEPRKLLIQLVLDKNSPPPWRFLRTCNFLHRRLMRSFGRS